MKAEACVVRNLKGDCAKSVVIVGRRWFDKINGNTYHSSEVYVDGEMVGREDFAYGYGEHYKQTAFQLLLDADCIDGSKEYKKIDPKEVQPAEHGRDYHLSTRNKVFDELRHNFIEDQYKNKDKYVVTVTDVGRKKDL